MNNQTDQLQKILLDAARQAGQHLKNNLGKIRTVEYKGVSNIVTNVDKESEAIIVDLIHTHFPGHAILTEEQGSLPKPSDFRWVIDPLDGTTNFAHGFPFFCVSIGIEYQGVSYMGAVYEPLRDELFYAHKGHGAYLNGERIAVSDRAVLGECMLATGFAYALDKRLANVEIFKKFLQEVQAIRRAGAAAVDLCYVACGRFDGFWEMALNLWDIAAGALLVEEAGGRVTYFTAPLSRPTSYNILATNPHIHGKMFEMVNGD